MSRNLAIILITALLALPAAAKERTWTSADGRTMQAEFVREVDGVATFLKDGKLVSVPLDKLSEKDQQIIRDLVMGKPVPDEDDPPAPNPPAPNSPAGDSPARTAGPNDTSTSTSPAENRPATERITIAVRTWTDNRGNTITAKFVRMNGADVVLNRSGRIVPISFHSLSEDDQQYVRDLLTQQGQEQLIPPPRAAGSNTGATGGSAGPVTSGLPSAPFPGGSGPGGARPGGAPLGGPMRGPGMNGPGSMGPGAMGPGRGGMGPIGAMPPGIGPGSGFPGGGIPGGLPGMSEPPTIPTPGEPGSSFPPNGVPLAGGPSGIGPGMTGQGMSTPGIGGSGPGMSGPGMTGRGFSSGPGAPFSSSGPSVPTSFPEPTFPGRTTGPNIPTGPMFQQVFTCSGCNREISQEQSKLDRCPYCKTLWVYKEDGSGRKQMTSSGVRNMAVGIIVGVAVVVLGGVAGFIGIIVAIVRAVSRPARANYRRY